MKTNDQQHPELLNKERQIRGIQELGMSAATAIGGIKIIEKIAEAAERKVAEVSQQVASTEQQAQILQTGQQIVATQALVVAEDQKKKIMTDTENAGMATAKAAFDTMKAQQEAAEKKKAEQKKSFKVSAPTSSSLVTKVAKGALDPMSMYQFFIPGGYFFPKLKDIL